jgi:hypothetical protein
MLKHKIMLKILKKCHQTLKKHEWAGHIDFTLDFSQGYTFSKFFGYKQ